MHKRTSSHGRRRPFSFGRFFGQIGEDLVAFAHTKAGIPVLCAGVAALCVLLSACFITLADNHPAAVSSPSAASASASEAASVSEAQADSSYDAQAEAIDVTAYSGTILPESDDAGDDYVDGTLFIGDSISVRYMSYGFTTLSNDIGVIGMGVEKITSLACVKFKTNSSMVTIPKAVAVMQPQRVVFGFGTNNLTGSVSSYIDTYEAAIQKVYEAYPYFDVIVAAIPPVDKYRDYPNVTMQNVDKFNAALVEMCEANGWKFLNTSEALKDSKTGFAKTDYTVADGLHLSKDGCAAYFDYFRTHAYETADRRPKPLKTVPARAETPPDLITSDPLKTAGSTAKKKVEVTFVATEGGTLSGTTEQSVKAGGTCTAVTAVPKEGFVFEGWSCSIGSIADTSAASLSFAVPSTDSAYGGIVVTASFKAKASYTVTFVLDPAAGGALSASNESSVSFSKIAAGDTVKCPLTLNTGYAVLGVSGGTYEEGMIVVTNVTENLTVKISLGLTATPTPAPTVPPTQAPTVPPATPTPTPAAPSSSEQTVPSSSTAPSSSVPADPSPSPSVDPPAAGEAPAAAEAQTTG